MHIDNGYKFDISVSTGAYPTTKPDKPWTIQYSTQIITIDELEQLQHQGKSFCYNFKDRDLSGLITQHEKTLKGFDHTNIIFFDIDKMPIPMDEYVKDLPYQPSLSYTTLSNGKNGKYGYRLIYTFDNPINSIEEFDNLYYSIAVANGFKKREYPDGTQYEFDYRKVNQQYYGGGLNSETIKSNIVYSFYDFSSFTNEGISLKETLYPPKKIISNDNTFPNRINIGEATRRQAYYTELENSFYKDLSFMPPKDFLFKYEKEYLGTYQSSIKSALIPSSDGSYWIYPEDYQEIKHQWGKDKSGKRKIIKWEIGSGRRKRLYVSAQIMKHNLPSITLEQLIFNLVLERFHYYINTDKKLNNNILIGIAESALSHTFELSPCKHPSFSINKDYWLPKNKTTYQATNIMRRVIKEEQILSLYDFNASIKENMKTLKENGIRVGKSTLYTIRKKYSDKKI